MDDEQYWALVDRARAVDPDDVPGSMVGVLRGLSPAEVVATDLAFRRISATGCTWALWGAAHLITGGCSDEGFDCFRGQVVALGREVFENAVADPDSLADVVDADGLAFDESMLDAPCTAHRALTGEELPAREPVPHPSLGEGWDFGDDAEMRARYPRLAAIFL